MASVIGAESCYEGSASICMIEKLWKKKCKKAKWLQQTEGLLTLMGKRKEKR